MGTATQDVDQVALHSNASRKPMVLAFTLQLDEGGPAVTPSWSDSDTDDDSRVDGSEQGLPARQRPAVAVRGSSIIPGTFMPRTGSVERPGRGHLLELAERLAFDSPDKFPTIHDALRHAFEQAKESRKRAMAARYEQYRQAKLREIERSRSRFKADLVGLVSDFRERFVAQMNQVHGDGAGSFPLHRDKGAVAGPMRSSDRLSFAHQVINKFFTDLKLEEDKELSAALAAALHPNRCVAAPAAPGLDSDGSQRAVHYTVDTFDATAFDDSSDDDRDTDDADSDDSDDSDASSADELGYGQRGAPRPSAAGTVWEGLDAEIEREVAAHERDAVAAVRIQAAYRGHAVRKRTRGGSRARRGSSHAIHDAPGSKVQLAAAQHTTERPGFNDWGGLDGEIEDRVGAHDRENAAAVKIQARYRGHMARQTLGAPGARDRMYAELDLPAGRRAADRPKDLVPGADGVVYSAVEVAQKRSVLPDDGSLDAEIEQAIEAHEHETHAAVVIQSAFRGHTARRTATARQNQHLSEPWFHGVTSGKDQDKRALQDPNGRFPDGVFFVSTVPADSHHHPAFVLSVNHRGQYTRHLVNSYGSGLVVNKKSYGRMNTICDLVESFSQSPHPAGWPAPLTRTVDRDTGKVVRLKGAASGRPVVAAAAAAAADQATASVNNLVLRTFTRDDKKVKPLGMSIRVRKGRFVVTKCKRKSLADGAVERGWVLQSANGVEATKKTKKVVLKALKRDRSLRIVFDTSLAN
eukprot:m.374871 g.374871  ORF g.374871 m.374871 type:complete len:750 (-) comp16692_c0_seq19:82-2331(-)